MNKEARIVCGRSDRSNRTRLRDNTLRGTSAGDPGFTSENRNDVTAITVSNFHRYPQTFSVAIRNMTSPNPYLLF